MTQDVKKLWPLVNAMEDRALQAHRAERNAESALRHELAELDAIRQAAMTSSGEIDVQQRLGVDVLWQGWLMQRRAQINADLALARARVHNTMHKAQREFARRTALESLAADADAKQKAQREKREEHALYALTLLSRKP